MADLCPWAQVRQGSQPLGRLSELERVVEDRLLRQARRHRVHVESVEGEPWGMGDQRTGRRKCTSFGEERASAPSEQVIVDSRGLGSSADEESTHFSIKGEEMAGSCSSVVRKRGCEALRSEKLSFSVVRGLEADFNGKGRFAKEVFWREEAGAPAVDGDGKVDCLGVEVLHSELSWMASSWLKCIGGAGHLDALENLETGERVRCSNCLVKRPSSATGIAAEDSLRTGSPKGLLRRSLSVG